MNDEYLIYLGQDVLSEKNNKYMINKYLSKGGNGFVFVCVDEKGKEYVLKLLHTTNSIKKENFKKEIKLQKEITSPYIVKCVDSGEHRFKRQKSPRPFYIMEKYDSTLEDLLNANTITPLKAYRYSIQLCNAVKTMHRHKPSIIHRDLKPENILYNKKKDCILVCDFGLAHVESNNKTINNGFAGNVDYHAPEQKKRGQAEVGTYTDIYSIGLIMNALFTKEIAQGEDYKRIWQVSPYFSFVDEIIDRMIKHDINKRESDINSIILDLERHNFEYEVEETLLKNLYKSKGVSNDNIKDIINLFSLLNYSIKNDMKWDEINLNYLCDYHFSCNKILRNSILIKCYYDRIKEKFEYEGNVYSTNCIPYKPIDISIDENKLLYDSFAKMIDSLEVIPEIFNTKNIIKKFFLSLCDYHANEIMKSDFNRIKENVDYYCLDAPILCISYFINREFDIFKSLNYNVTNYVVFDKFEETNVSDKNEFYRDNNKVLKKLIDKIKSSISGVTCSIRNGKLEVSFDDLSCEELFENKIRDIATSITESSIRSSEILSIIDSGDLVGLNKVYFIDDVDASLIMQQW